MTTSDQSAQLRVAVVTGGHYFDTLEFHELFDGLPGITPVIQHLEDWCAAKPEVRASYDVVVFYIMMMQGPTDEGLPWYAGKQLSALSELGREGQGIVVLHHAILAFPQWQPWNDLVGIQNRKFGYHWEGDPTTEVADATHPITRGLPAATWALKDETYTMDEPTGPDVHLLLTTKHHKSMKANAWTNRYKGSRVFCYQSGHGAPVYADTNFRAVLTRGIGWVARGAAEVPATMPAIWFTAKGKTEVLNDVTPVGGPGRVLVKTLFTGVTNGTERNVLTGGSYNGKLSYPGRCGYQNVGEVIEVGPGAPGGWQVGDRVFSGCFHHHVGLWEMQSGWISDLIVKLPAGIDLKHAALFGVASVAMHDVRRAEVKLGERVLVIGAGLIGQFAAQSARACGAVVTIVDRVPQRLALAKTLGADAAIDVTTSWDAVAPNGPFDVVLETSGAKGVLDEVIGTGFGSARRLVSHRGRNRVVLIAGRDRVDYAFNAGQDTEVSMQHVGHFDRCDLESVVHLVANGTIKVGPLIQDVLPLSAAPAFYDRLRDDPASTFGTVFDWGQA